MLYCSIQQVHYDNTKCCCNIWKKFIRRFQILEHLRWPLTRGFPTYSSSEVKKHWRQVDECHEATSSNG